MEVFWCHFEVTLGIWPSNGRCDAYKCGLGGAQKRKCARHSGHKRIQVAPELRQCGFLRRFAAVLALPVTRNDGQTADERMEGRKQAQVEGLKTGRMEGRMEKWKNERMEEKTEGWKSGSLPSQPCAPEGPADFGRVLEHQDAHQRLC